MYMYTHIPKTKYVDFEIWLMILRILKSTIESVVRLCVNRTVALRFTFCYWIAFVSLEAWLLCIWNVELMRYCMMNLIWNARQIRFKMTKSIFFIHFKVISIVTNNWQKIMSIQATNCLYVATVCDSYFTAGKYCISTGLKFFLISFLLILLKRVVEKLLLIKQKLKYKHCHFN